jgi:hypothetical protein
MFPARYTVNMFDNMVAALSLGAALFSDAENDLQDVTKSRTK